MLIRKAAEKGNHKARFLLYVCLHNGFGIEKDQRAALEWMPRPGLDSAFVLAQAVEEGGRGFDPDPRVAVELYRRIAETGDARAQFALGTCLYYGKGVAHDLSEAKVWFLKAAQGGYMHECVAGSQYSSLHLMLDAKANLDELRNTVTPLMLAVKQENQNAVDTLLRHNADVNYAPLSGDSALDIAVQHTHTWQAFEPLVKYRAFAHPDRARRWDSENELVDALQHTSRANVVTAADSLFHNSCFPA